MRFRELIQPGTNFEFVGKTRMFLTISVIAVLFSIAMLPINHFLRGSALNFSLDFKGGTDIVVTFAKPVSAGDVRKAMEDSGHKQVDVSTFKFRDEAGAVKDAYLVRVPEFGALGKVQADSIANELVQKEGGPQVVAKATWSGDTFYVRSSKAFPETEFKSFLSSKGLDTKPWTPEQTKAFSTPVVGTNEYNYQVTVYGLDRKVQTALSQKLGTDVQIKQVDAVGPKAGEELRNDGIK